MNYKKKSQKQEKDIAKKVQGKTVVASGALWGAKGDVRTNDFLIEAKTTEKGFYTLKADTWEKIAREANDDNLRIPLIVIDINNGDSRLVVFNINDFNCPFNKTDAEKCRKSIRVSYNSLGTVFCLVGNCTNFLSCMNFKEFIEVYI